MLGGDPNWFVSSSPSMDACQREGSTFFSDHISPDKNNHTNVQRHGKQEGILYCICNTTIPSQPYDIFQSQVGTLFRLSTVLIPSPIYIPENQVFSPTSIHISEVYLSKYFCLYFLGLNIFIGPRSDHSLPMSVTNWLTDSLSHDLVEDWMNWPFLTTILNSTLMHIYAKYAYYA